MSSQPGGDTSWDTVLVHRPPDTRRPVRERFEAAGVAPELVLAALAVEALLDDFSAVTVAGRLGVSRQKVYDIARPNPTSSFIDHAPWRLP
jgi:hypothetical protein